MARIELSFDAWKDGRVAPATVEMPVAVLDVTDSKELRTTLKDLAEPVRRLAFSPDGSTLATGGSGEGVILWDVASARQRRMLKHPGRFTDLAFTPDGRSLLVSWYESFDPDGKALTPTSRGGLKGYRGGVVLWDVQTGKERGALRRESPRGVFALALAPDGKTLAAQEVWREDDGKQSRIGIALWDMTTGKVRSEITDQKAVHSLAFAPNGKTLAFGIAGGVLLWDVNASQRRALLDGGEMWVSALAFAPDGKTLAGCHYREGIILWDVASGKEKGRLPAGETQTASCLAFAPDGATLAVGVGPRNTRNIEAGEVVLWDVSTTKKRRTLRGHIGNVWALAFSPDGKLLASGGADKTIKLWDVAPVAASQR